MRSNLKERVVLLLFGFLWLTLAGNTLAEEIANGTPVEHLRWVENADPIADARAAINAQNFVLLGVRGYTWTIPGIAEPRKFEYRTKYGVKLLDGTGDVILSAEHARLLKMATTYAERYNRYILEHVSR